MCKFLNKILIITKVSSEKLVDIKIIEEPANFNMPNNFVQRSINDFTDDSVSLKPKLKPAKFSGPNHMSKINGQCFEKITNKYASENFYH